ncbi:MAG: response regulator [Candidatus Omnitrophica bacterium]|nr:response regulator [Candidatus Omnitrophota bacterium]
METKRVLVVDDEPEVTFALQAFFIGKGYEMMTALDGLQAMRLLRQHPVDLVILDMKMPGVNGIEVLKFIHAQSPSTKVVVVTAYDVQFQELVEQLGVDGFLIKPFGIQALTSTIEEVLAREKGAEPPVPVKDGHEPAAESRIPKARLLFVEPSEYTYKLKEVFFSDPQRSGGLYEVAAAYAGEEVLPYLESFRPDVLLVDLAMLGQTRDLLTRVMNSPSKPREIILYGSGSVLPGHGGEMENLSRLGVKVIQNESFTRAGLVRLGEVIRKTALAQGLHAAA